MYRYIVRVVTPRRWAYSVICALLSFSAPSERSMKAIHFVVLSMCGHISRINLYRHPDEIERPLELPSGGKTGGFHALNMVISGMAVIP